MSSFITSDYTVMAIVKGMNRYGFMDDGKEDIQDMADTLRVVNEHMTARRYSDVVSVDAVNIEHTRDFTDAEIWNSCRCWLYQIDTGNPMTLDEITIKAAVEKLAETIKESNLENGKWRYGKGPYCNDLLGEDEEGCWVELYDLAEWDLSE